MAVRRRLRLRAGAELYLEIGEERADERCIQIGECQGRWGLPQPHLCEHEQQPERVPVGGDRVGANIALFVPQQLSDLRQGRARSEKLGSETVSEDMGAAVRATFDSN